MKDYINKWTIGGVFILLIIAAACYLYDQQTTAEYKKESAKADQLLQDWKAKKAQKTPVLAETESTPEPAETGLFSFRFFGYIFHISI